MSSQSFGIVRAAALIPVLFMHACDTTEPGPDSVNVSPRTARLILAGDTVQLSAEVRDKSGNAMPDVVVKLGERRHAGRDGDRDGAGDGGE